MPLQRQFQNFWISAKQQSYQKTRKTEKDESRTQIKK